MPAAVNLLDAYVTLRTKGTAKIAADFESARRAAARFLTANRDLVAIQDEYNRRLDLARARYRAGQLSAEQFGKVAAAVQDSASAKAQQLGEQIAKQAAAAQKTAAGMRALGLTLAVTAATLGGFVRSGLAGTTLGERLSLQFQ